MCICDTPAEGCSRDEVSPRAVREIHTLRPRRARVTRPVLHAKLTGPFWPPWRPSSNPFLGHIRPTPRRRRRTGRAGARRSPRQAPNRQGTLSSNIHAEPFQLGYPRTELRRKLVAAVLSGEKTATSSLRSEYTPHTNEPLPQVGDRHLLLGLDDEPTGVVETIEVREFESWRHRPCLCARRR
jgi:ASCH domain-containing protein